MKRKKVIILAITALTLVFLIAGLAACNAAESDGSYTGGGQNGLAAPSGSDSGVVRDSVTGTGADGSTNTGSTASAERKIVYYVDLTVNVASPSETVGRVLSLMQGDEWTDSQTQYSDNSYSLVIRVKTARLDAFLAEIKGEGDVAYFRQTADDISDQFVDIERQRSALEAEAAYLQEMLETDTSLTADLRLTIITRIHTINSLLDKNFAYESRLQSLVDYSTVRLTVEPTGAAAAEPTYGEKVKQAFKDGWEGFKQFTVGFWVALPILAVAAGLACAIIIPLYKKRKKARAAGGNSISADESGTSNNQNASGESSESCNMKVDD